MIKMLSKFGFVGLILALLSLSQNSLAHAGMENDSLLHSVLHVSFSVVVAIAVIAISFVVVKRFPKVIKIKSKK